MLGLGEKQSIVQEMLDSLNLNDYLSAHVPRVVKKNFLAKMSGVDMSVDLGGSNGFVTQHGLDSTQIGTPFKQTGGKRMAKSVGRDRFPNASLCHEVLYQNEDHLASEGFLTPKADEDKILIVERNGQEVATQKIKLEFVNGFSRNGYQPLLGSLSFHLDKLVIEKKIAEFQIGQFAHP